MAVPFTQTITSTGGSNYWEIAGSFVVTVAEGAGASAAGTLQFQTEAMQAVDLWTDVPDANAAFTAGNNFMFKAEGGSGIRFRVNFTTATGGDIYLQASPQRYY